jgi:hypothetical protein
MTEGIWQKIARQHEELRDPKLRLLDATRSRLIHWSRLHIIDSNQLHALRPEPTADHGRQLMTRRERPIRVQLPNMQPAWLGVLLKVDKRGGLLAYALSLHGTGKLNLESSEPPGPGACPWHILVHFDDGPKGSGLATHALLHAHVWPGHALSPAVRIPLPALPPPDALDWMFAAAGTQDPAPHPRA